MSRQFSLLITDLWVEVKDGNDTARAIFDCHYSRYIYRDGREPKLFVGPGEKLVLISPWADSLFVWRKFRSADHQVGVNCAVFRNEGPLLSSDLIRDAMKWAWNKWPGERLYTYVNPRKIRSVNPGFCFKMAGWKFCGISKKRKLAILDVYP